jgi:hypothetical protein
MAATIQNLFPFTYCRAEDFIVYPCALKFYAPVIAGKYVFNGTTTPAQRFGKLLQKQKGIIAGVMVSANCSERDFTAAIDEPLKLQILHDGNGTPVNMSPFPFSNFSQSENFQLQWEASGTTRTQEEFFKLGISGSVDQLQNMTSNELQLNVVFNFIRVGSDKLQSYPETLKNQDYIKLMREVTTLVDHYGR